MDNFIDPVFCWISLAFALWTLVFRLHRHWITFFLSSISYLPLLFFVFLIRTPSWSLINVAVTETTKMTDGFPFYVIASHVLIDRSKTEKNLLSFGLLDLIFLLRFIYLPNKISESALSYERNIQKKWIIRVRRFRFFKNFSFPTNIFINSKDFFKRIGFVR